MSDELVREWVRKAEQDWTALQVLAQGDVGLVADVMAFHAQQCAEKYLKAMLQKHGMAPPRIHSLSALLDMLNASEENFDTIRAECEYLSPFAVNFRYPGEESTRDDAVEAMNCAETIRKEIRGRFGFPCESSHRGRR